MASRIQLTPLEAASVLTGGGLLQQLNTTSYCAPGYAGAASGEGSVGCLGMPGGSSADPKGKGRGKGKAKGKDGDGPTTFPKRTKKANHGSISMNLHACSVQHSCVVYLHTFAHYQQPRDVMPEEAVPAAEWAVNKLIKLVGEAKTIVIRLSNVKHQDKLRTLVFYIGPTCCMDFP